LVAEFGFRAFASLARKLAQKTRLQGKAGDYRERLQVLQISRKFSFLFIYLSRFGEYKRRSCTNTADSPVKAGPENRKGIGCRFKPIREAIFSRKEVLRRSSRFISLSDGNEEEG
jgi:hypothetical protein